MTFVMRLSFSVLMAIGVLAVYSQISTHLPFEFSACLDGERFTIHRAWRGIGRGPDGGLRLKWENWITPDGENCGASGGGAMANNPEQTG